MYKNSFNGAQCITGIQLFPIIRTCTTCLKRMTRKGYRKVRKTWVKGKRKILIIHDNLYNFKLNASFFFFFFLSHITASFSTGQNQVRYPKEVIQS